jgi:hypothetical protein
LAEARAGSLSHLDLELDPSLAPEEAAALRRGFEAGWAWGASWHWLLPVRHPGAPLAATPW